MSDPARHPGRPPLSVGEGTEPVHVRLPWSVFDQLDAYARARGVPLRQIVRETIYRGLATSPAPPPDFHL